VVRVDYFLPGCPPSATPSGNIFTALILGHMPRLEPMAMNYD